MIKKSNKKLKLFLDNMFVYGLGGIISKIIPVIMVPIITRLLPDTAYYGLSDLCTTIISFGSALAVLGMYDAMYRMYFEEDSVEYKKRVCSTTLMFTLCMSVIVFIFLVVCRRILSKQVFGDEKYTYLVWIVAFAVVVGASNNIIAAPTRMQNKRKQFLLVNFLTAILAYSIPIPLILKKYYVIALPVGILVSRIMVEVIYWMLNKSWFQFRSVDMRLLKPLLKLAVPLFPTFLVYWIFNASDKLMIQHFLNTGQVGIYSTGAKLGHCSQLIYTAFAGGWQYFAFATMKEKNQVESNSKIFEYLGVISLFCTMFVFALSEPLFQILFTGNYRLGYIVAPYLFLSPLLQMLFQVASNQFLIIKKTWPITLTLIGGALINVALNVYLIPRLGIEGAAIATLLGYTIAIFVCIIFLVRMKLMVFRSRFLFIVIISFIYILSWRLHFRNNWKLAFTIALILPAIMVWLYKKDLAEILESSKQR